VVVCFERSNDSERIAISGSIETALEKDLLHGSIYKIGFCPSSGTRSCATVDEKRQVMRL